MFIEFTERDGMKVTAVSPTIRVQDSGQIDNPNRYHVIIGENMQIYAVEREEYDRLVRYVKNFGHQGGVR